MGKSDRRMNTKQDLSQAEWVGAPTFVIGTMSHEDVQNIPVVPPWFACVTSCSSITLIVNNKRRIVNG